MRRKFCILAAASALLLCSCAVKEERQEPAGHRDNVREMTFSAAVGEAEKTILSGHDVLWDNDAISIFDGTSNNKFTTTASGSKTASFTGEAADVDTFYAICPYYSGTIKDGSSVATNFNYHYDGGLVIYNHPVQKLTAGTYDPQALYSVAKFSASDTQFTLKHVSGLVKFTLQDSDITEIEFRGNDHEFISGTANVSIADDGTPTIDSYKSSLGMQFVILRPSSGEVFTPGTYYMVLPPKVFAKGFSLKFKNTAGKIAERTSNKSLTVTRAAIINLGTIDGSGLVWNEYLEINFLNYCRQGSFTPPGCSAAESISWPFTSPKKSTFPSSINTVTGVTHVRTAAVTSSDETCYLYANKFSSTHPLYGFRMSEESGKRPYFEVPGRAGKVIFRVDLVDSKTVRLADTDGTTLTGGEAPSASAGLSGETTWYPTVEAGAGLRIVGTGTDLTIWRIRVYYTDATNADTKAKTKILCIGNSFNRDAIYHLPAMLKNAGIDDVSITFAYRQGATMSYHCDWTNSDYTLYKSDAGSGKWTAVTGYYASDKAAIGLEEICKRDNWDIVTLHEYTGNISAWEWNDTEKGYFDAMFAHLDATLSKTPKYYYILTHAFYDMTMLKGAQGSLWDQHETAKMFATCAATAKKIIEEYPDRFEGIISTGAAVENLRTTSLMNTEYGLSRDGAHLDYGVARCAAACTFFESVITPLRLTKLDNNGFTYDGSEMTDGLYNTPVTTENFPTCLKAARAAIAHPYEVTAQ